MNRHVRHEQSRCIVCTLCAHAALGQLECPVNTVLHGMDRPGRCVSGQCCIGMHGVTDTVLDACGIPLCAARDKQLEFPEKTTHWTQVRGWKRNSGSVACTAASPQCHMHSATCIVPSAW
jgi:hypothetical protein